MLLTRLIEKADSLILYTALVKSFLLCFSLFKHGTSVAPVHCTQMASHCVKVFDNSIAYLSVWITSDNVKKLLTLGLMTVSFITILYSFPLSAFVIVLKLLSFMGMPRAWKSCLRRTAHHLSFPGVQLPVKAPVTTRGGCLENGRKKQVGRRE